MSHIYTPTGTGSYVGAYTMPDDGDPRSAAAFNVPMEGMAEDLKRTRDEAAAGNVNFVVSRMFEFLLPDTTTAWDRVMENLFAPNERYWSQQAHASVHSIEAPLALPSFFEITSVRVWFDPLTGRAGVPAVRPKIELRRQQLTLGPLMSGVLLGTATEPVAITQPQYEQLHNLEIVLGAPHVVDQASSTYAVVFSGESGANAQNNTRLYSVVVSGTVKRVF